MIDEVHERLASVERRLAVAEANDNHRRQYVDYQFSTASRAIQVALTANDKRLDGLNEFRGALSDMSNRMISRAEVEARSSSMAEKFDSEIGALRAKIELRDRPNYVLAISAASAFLVVIGGLWTVIGLKVENAIGPIVVKEEVISAAEVTHSHEINVIGDRLSELGRLQMINGEKVAVMNARTVDQQTAPRASP